MSFIIFQRSREYHLAKRRDQRMGEVSRPQDDPRNLAFFKDSVRRNLGLPKPAIDDLDPAEKYSSELVYTTEKLSTRQPEWISSEEEMKSLWKVIKATGEVAVDFENNIDHSYLGNF